MNIVSTYTWCQFAPAFALVGLAALLILADALLPKLPKRLYAGIAALGAFVAAFFMVSGEHANLFGFIATVATGLSILLAFDYTKVCCESIAGGGNEEGTGEFYALPLVACAGILCLTQARDLVMLFVSLEVVTLTSYGHIITVFSLVYSDLGLPRSIQTLGFPRSSVDKESARNA